MTIWVVRAFAVLMLGALAGCTAPAAPSSNASGAATSASSGPKRIVAVIRGDPVTLATAIDEAGAGKTPGLDQVEMMLNAGLGAYDAKNVLQPRLAEQVPTVDNGQWVVNPDGTMRTTWHLRPNVTWQDGTPLTSDDLIFAIRAVQEPKAGISTTTSYNLITSTEASDPQTFTATWSAPFIHADALFATSAPGGLKLMPLPAHLLRQQFEQDASTFNQLPYFTSEFVGLGPFALSDFTRSSYLTAKANDRYALGRPRLDEVEVRFITDPNTIASNLLAGAVELTLNSRLDIDWGMQIRDAWPDGQLEPILGASLVNAFPQFIDPDPAIQSDVKFREALVRAINRQEMSDNFLAGMSSVADSLVGPNDPAYAAVDSSVANYPYDPRVSAQLLDGLGLTKGGDGMYRDSTGQPLSMEVRARQGDTIQEKMTVAISDYLRRVGIATTQNIFGAQLANDREFRATHPGLEVVRGPAGPDGLSDYPTSEVATAANNWRGSNHARYIDPAFDGLIKRYFTTVPLGERNQVLGQALGIMTRNIVSIPLDYSVDVTMVANRIVGIEGQNPAWNASLWDVK